MKIFFRELLLKKIYVICYSMLIWHFVKGQDAKVDELTDFKDGGVISKSGNFEFFSFV